MLSWEVLQLFGAWAVAMFVLGLWLKREIDRGDRVIGELAQKNAELQDKLEALAEKGQTLGFETKQQMATMAQIISAGGRSA